MDLSLVRYECNFSQLKKWCIMYMKFLCVINLASRYQVSLALKVMVKTNGCTTNLRIRGRVFTARNKNSLRFEIQSRFSGVRYRRAWICFDLSWFLRSLVWTPKLWVFECLFIPWLSFKNNKSKYERKVLKYYHWNLSLLMEKIMNSRLPLKSLAGPMLFTHCPARSCTISNDPFLGYAAYLDFSLDHNYSIEDFFVHTKTTLGTSQ